MIVHELLDARKTCEFARWEKLWLSLPDSLRDVYFHPSYSLADSARYRDVAPSLLVVRNQDAVYLEPLQYRRIGSTGYFDVSTPYGYGGPLVAAKNGASLAALRDVVTSAWGMVSADLSIVAGFRRFHPLIADQASVIGTLAVKKNSTFFLSFGGVETEEDILRLFSVKSRNQVRRAMKAGLQVVIEELTGAQYLSQFRSLYKTTMNRLDASLGYYFPEAYYETLAAVPKSYLVSVADDMGELLSGAILLTGGKWAHYHLSASNVEALPLRVNNLLLHSVAVFSWKMGLEGLHLGGGVTPGDGLEHFKAGFATDSCGFYVGNTVYKEEVYEQFCYAAPDSSFFPAYRALPEYQLSFIEG